MSEPFANEMLSAYLDGDLTDGERTELEASLAADPALQAELDALTEARRFLAEHGPVAAPAGFLEDVLAAVEDEPQVVQLAWYRRPFGIPIEGLAVAAAALLVVYIAMPGSRAPEDSAGKGAGAAIIEQPATEKVSKKNGPSSSYGSDAAADATTRSNEDAGPGAEGTVDPANNMWEPPDEADQDAVADVQLGTEALKTGIDDELDIPLNKGKGFGLVENAKEEASRMKAQEVERKKGEEEAAARAAAEAARKEAEEQQGTNFTRVPYSYTLYTEDAEVLYRLSAIAAKHRGEVTDSDKSALEVTELTGTDGATVLVKIPSHALQAFGQELGLLGNLYSTADNTMFAGDPVEVRVRVELAAGAPEGTSEPKNAARKSRQYEEADMVEEALAE